MKESKAVYVRKRDFNAELNREYQFYATKVVRDVEYFPEPARYDQNTQEVGCQYDSKRDNRICTCRYLAPPKRRLDIKYYGSPKQIYAYQRSRSFTDIGVGSVKALQRKKVKRIYLPETIERGVGSSDLSAYFLQRTKQHRASSYYENKRTSSKCVGGILEYNIGCVINEKLSPIIQTISGSTSYKGSTFNKTIEIGSSSIVKSLTNTTTQVDNSSKKDIETKSEVGIAEIAKIQPIIIIQEDSREMKTITLDSCKTTKTKGKSAEKRSSDSLLQHVHNLENPSAERNSHMSLEAEDLMENKLEMQYRNMFAAKSRSKDSKHSSHNSDLKIASTLKRRFEALRRGLVKKADSKKNAVIVNKVSSQVSARSRKDVSINSDPPSLEGRSFSNTKPYSPFTTRYNQDKTMYNPRSSHYRRSVIGNKKERGSAEWSSKAADDDSESQGVKGMFKLWGKKFNLEEDHYKRRCTPKPSYNSSKKGPTKKPVLPKVQVKTSKREIDEKKEGRKFFFFKNKKNTKEKPFKPKKGVTAGRCEVRDGLVVKILGGNVFDPEDIEKEPQIKPDDYGEIVRKAWLKKFLTPSIDSRNSVKVRWNNKTYAPSSSTVFELMDNIYKDNSIIFKSKSQLTVQSSYKSYKRQHVNFMQQNIEAWMIPKTITDSPNLQLPVKQIKQQLTFKSDENRKDNMEVRISDQKWFIDKSKAFSHKIEVVLHSKNFRKLNKEESSEYLRIDIPKGFFLDSSDDEIKKHTTNQSSDEKVFKIVEYETASDLKKDKATRNLNIGDHKQNKIKMTVSVKENKKCVEEVLKTTIKKPMRRDVVVQGSNVYIPKMCDVVGVGIITHRDLSKIRKPILKIQDNFSDEESEHNLLKPHTKKCEFAESYLQEYYRHWTPLGIDLYSWCVSDSKLKCSSEHSRSSYHNQGAGTKSCPNIFEDFQTSTIVSSCGASSCSQCYKLKDNASDRKNKKNKKNDGKKSDPDRRVLPKDSIEVFKRRKIYAASMKSKWVCPNPEFDQASTVQSYESCVKVGQTTPQTECPKLIRPCCKTIQAPKRRKRPCKKHVSLPDCDTMNNSLARQLSSKLPESILAFKGSGCDICKKKLGSYCPKHATVNPQPISEIPRAPCRDSCEEMKNPPCSASKQTCDKPPPCPPPCPSTCPSSDLKSLPSCPPTPQPCKKPSPSGPKQPPRPVSPTKWTAECPPKKKPACLPSPPYPSKKKTTCPPSPTCPPKKKPPSPPSPPCPPKKKSLSCPPTPRTPPSPPCPTKRLPCPPKKPPSYPHSPPSPPESPPSCPPSPPSPKPSFRQSPSCAPSPPSCMKPARCPLHPSCANIHIVECPPPSDPSPPCPPAPSCLPPPKPCICPPLPPPSCPRPHSPPCPSTPPSCAPEESPASSPPRPDTPPCTPPPCIKRNKKCPKAPPSCPESPPSCCSDPNRCPALPPPCKTSSNGFKKLFKRKSPQVCPASSPCKPTPCKQSFCRSLECQHSMTSISYKSLHPEAPFYYSPIHPCPPEEELKKPKPKKCSTSPCNTNDDFPWPTKNQMSNQSSRTSLCQNYQKPNGQCKRDCSMMPRMSCETVPSLKILKKIDCKTSCPNYPGSPRLPCLIKISGMQCPAMPHRPSPPAEPIKVSTPVPSKSKSKISGLFLKMMPSTKKSTCSKDCLAWKSGKHEDGCISLNSKEKITIRLKKETPSTEEIREGFNIKVQDEDGMTLFERKDYRLQHAGCSINRRPSLLGEMYKASEVRRVTTNDSAQAIGTDKDKCKEIKDVVSDASIANLIEIQFKLKVTQGEKTTEIDIANDSEKENGENIEHKRPRKKSAQEVFVLKNEGERPAEHSDQKNDINIRIVIKNFKSKSGKKKSVNLKHEDYNDFSKQISAKFHTVSTGYSDIFHDDKVFSVHRATVDLTSSVDNTKTNYTSMHSNRSMHSKKNVLTKKSVHSNKSVEIMNEPANEIGRAILMGCSEISVCRCITTEEEKSEDNETKSYPSQKYSYTKEVHDNAEETDTQLTDHKYEYNEDTDTDKPMKYDTEETDTDRQVDPPKYDTETDTEKQPNTKYDTFMSTTDTDEPDTLPELKKSHSLDVIVKPQSKDEKKELLKQVMERVHDTKFKNKTRMRKLRDMLKVILTSDISDHEEDKVPASDLAKDVTYASLKPNYFRDTDSMNNYYKVDSKTVLSEAAINRQIVYPTVENNSDCSNSVRSVDVLSSENESKRGGGCMCSTVAARLKQASRLGCEGGGCCCGAKQVFKKNEETTCDLKRESDYTQIDYKTTEFVDVQTQNSRYLTSKINSTNLSVHSSIRPSIGGSFKFKEGIEADSGVLNVDSRELSLRKTISPERCHVRECEMRKRNRDAILSISDEEKVVLLSGPSTRKDEKKDVTGMHASDILQSYEAKKAVLEIYTEKTISDDGEHLVAKLPKFVYDREQEIQANYEAMATNTYKTVCKKNIIMMAIKR